MKALVKRVRPEGGGLDWIPHFNATHCLGCDEWESVHRAVWSDPERLAAHMEALVIDHTECWEFNDPKMARDARRYRKEKKRRELLKGRVGNAFDRMSVAAQRESWRGRG